MTDKERLILKPEDLSSSELAIYAKDFARSIMATAVAMDELKLGKEERNITAERLTLVYTYFIRQIVPRKIDEALQLLETESEGVKTNRNLTFLGKTEMLTNITLAHTLLKYHQPTEKNFTVGLVHNELP